MWGQISFLTYGSFSFSPVAFDEDFESEMTDNNDAKLEVSLLAKSPDAELTEVSYTLFGADEERS